jgi:hypothetical protein
MHAELLARALINDSGYTLSPMKDEDSRIAPREEDNVSFVVLSESGETVGYIKAWHDEDDYAGFVHFDADGNVIDWKTFTKVRGSIRSH